MKLLILFALTIASTTALHLPKEEIQEKQPEISHQGRITGGKDADIKNFNYQVGLTLIKYENKSESFSWCGGSLISHNWVLTAAHCTFGQNIIIVYFGSSKRAQADNEFVIVRSFDNIIEHELYDDNTLINDIALIRIPTIEYSKTIGPVHLPRRGFNVSLVGKYATASGWGDMGEYAEYDAQHLQSVTMRIISNEQCLEQIEDVKDGNICLATDDEYTVRATCGGDSGGPLVLFETNLQIGLTSFGHALGCEAGRPDVFTRVSYYIDWIIKNTGIKF